MQDCTEAPGEDRAEEVAAETAQHTGLPWKARRINEDNSRGPKGHYEISAPTREWNQQTCVVQCIYKASHANLIVRAVNSHYELLEALRDVLWKLEHFDEFETPERNAFVENAPIHIHAAIAKAEGGGDAD